MNHESVKVLVGTVSGLIVGGLVGYVVTRRVLVDKYDELLDIEVDRIKRFYKGLNEEEEKSLVEDVESEQDRIEKLIDQRNSELINQLGYGLEKQDEEEPSTVTVELKDGTVYEAEQVSHTKMGLEVPPIVDDTPIDYKSREFLDMVERRDDQFPYVITVDEFMDDRPEYEKNILTYFEGDDTLCDSRDQVIPDIEDTVGDDALTMFGKWSKDQYIVYVRNDRISSDFEVAYDERSYVEAIAGFKKRNVMKKMREDD